MAFFNHSIIRIDEVSRRGSANIKPADSDAKVRALPVYTRQTSDPGRDS